jgi:hypothetical protein
VSVEHSPDHGIAYHFVCYDTSGRERRGERGLASDQIMAAATGEHPSDIFVFSHGWNADPEAAVAQYGRWVDTMAARTGDRERLCARAGGFRPLLIGVHWPSRAWADEDLTSMSYAVDPAPDTATHWAKGPAVTDPVERLVADYADRLGGGPNARDAIRVIVESALRDAAPPTLPEAVRDAYQHLNNTLGLENAGEGAAPGDDREPFDPEGTYQAALLMDLTDPVPYGGFSLGGALAPLRVLSFWTMKRRACAFGEAGAGDLLGRLQDSSPDCRFHIMGHSFGCIVASAAVAGAPGTPGPRRGVDSLVLVQGAMSLWSFCADIPAHPGRPGYFHRLVRERLVKGPTLVTTSTHDRAVRVFYPLGAGVSGNVEFGDVNLPVYGGVGTFGVRGPGIQIRDETLGQVDECYPLHPGVVYNLKADTVIATSAGISGAHSDICHPEVARAVWRAVEEQPESAIP